MKVRINCVCDIDKNEYEQLTNIKKILESSNYKNLFVNLFSTPININEVYMASVLPLEKKELLSAENTRKCVHNLMKNNIKLYKEYFDSDGINEVKKIFLDNIIDSPTLLYYFLKELICDNNLKFRDLLYDRDIFDTILDEFDKFRITGINDSERKYQESVNEEFDERIYNYIRDYKELIPLTDYLDTSKDFKKLYDNNTLIGFHYIKDKDEKFVLNADKIKDICFGVGYYNKT